MRRRKGRSPGRKPRPAQALPRPPAATTPTDRDQTTKRRGEISELAAARHAFGISKPFTPRLPA